MTQILEIPLMGLENDFPETLFVLHHASSDRYGCFQHDGVHGVACFSSENAAFRFSEFIELSGMQTKEISFDDAREVAKGRPMPVISLMLLDRLHDPEIHFVR